MIDRSSTSPPLTSAACLDRDEEMARRRRVFDGMMKQWLADRVESEDVAIQGGVAERWLAERAGLQVKREAMNTVLAAAVPVVPPDLLAKLRRMMADMPKPLPLVVVTTWLPDTKRDELFFIASPDARHMLSQYFTRDIWCGRDVIFCAPDQARRMHDSVPLALRQRLSPESAVYEMGCEPRAEPDLPPFRTQPGP